MIQQEYMTSVEVCYLLGVTENTLRNWYKWYKIKEADCPELPMPEKIKNKNYWHKSDLNKLIVFKNWIPKGRNGVMGVVNRKFFPKKKNNA